MRATGLPRFVITKDAPAATSSRKARHFDLNSVAGICFSGTVLLWDLPNDQSSGHFGLTEWSGELGFAHEMEVDGASGFAAFGNRPDYQRLATPRVSGCENTGDR